MILGAILIILILIILFLLNIEYFPSDKEDPQKFLMYMHKINKQLKERV